jgi:hypothetical protein
MRLLTPLLSVAAVPCPPFGPGEPTDTEFDAVQVRP